MFYLAVNCPLDWSDHLCDLQNKKISVIYGTKSEIPPRKVRFGEKYWTSCFVATAGFQLGRFGVRRTHVWKLLSFSPSDTSEYKKKLSSHFWLPQLKFTGDFFGRGGNSWTKIGSFQGLIFAKDFSLCWWQNFFSKSLDSHRKIPAPFLRGTAHRKRYELCIKWPDKICNRELRKNIIVFFSLDVFTNSLHLYISFRVTSMQANRLAYLFTFFIIFHNRARNTVC